MQYRRLGGSGLKVSTFSIGSWLTFGGQVGLREARECLDAALDAGVNFIDNAEVYSAGVAELVIGQLIRSYKREDLVISSKSFGAEMDQMNEVFLENMLLKLAMMPYKE